MQSTETSSMSHPMASTTSAAFSAYSQTGSPNDSSSTQNPTTSTDRRRQSEYGSTSDTCTESSEEEVLLSVFWKNGQLGAASYAVGSPVVYVLNDSADNDKMGFSTVEMIFQQVQPTQAITSESMPKPFLAALNRLTQKEQPSSSSRARLHLLPSLEFRDENCSRRVLALRLQSKPKEWTDENHINYLRTTLNFNAYAMIQSLGGLLKFMDKNLCSLNILSVDNSFVGLRIMTAKSLVSIDQETYKALAIFPKKKTSFSKWAQRDSQDPTSVFGVFNRCRTNIGSQFMRAMFLKPTNDLSVIAERQEVISFCMDMRNDEYVSNFLSSIGQVKGVATLHTKLRGLQQSTTMWRNLHTTLQSILLVAEICGHLEQNVKFFSKIRNIVTGDLSTVTRIIATIVDFDDPDGRDKFVIRTGIDPDLDHKKRVYSELPIMLNKLAEIEIEDLPQCIDSCIITYYPEIGFLLTVQEWKTDLSEREMQLPGYQYKFRSNGLIHYKSRRCHELDEALGDPVVDISEAQLCLMMRLVEYVQEHVETILDAVNLIAELDCLISFARVAREHNYVKPKMTKDHRIDITQGRYLLEEAIGTPFVPNDVQSDTEFGLVKIITGVNNGGKTVYLKQTALIVFLAHLGSFVPAQKATIEVMDRICTSVRPAGAVSSGMSSYMSDVRQLNIAVNYPGSASLIIIDEFGRSTIDSNGRALLAASLNYFLRRGATGCPHVLVATHYANLVHVVLQTPLLCQQKMEHMLSAEGEITNLYRLVDGHATCSLALQAAKIAELRQSIIRRAEELAAGEAPVLPTDMSLQKKKRDAILQTLLEYPRETQEELEDLIKTIKNIRLS